MSLLNIFINHTTLPMNCVFEILRYVSPVNKNELVKVKEGLKELPKRHIKTGDKDENYFMDKVYWSLYDYRFTCFRIFDSLDYDEIRNLCKNNGLKYYKTDTIKYQLKNIGNILNLYYPNFVRKF